MPHGILVHRRPVIAAGLPYVDHLAHAAPVVHHPHGVRLTTGKGECHLRRAHARQKENVDGKHLLAYKYIIKYYVPV